MSACLLVAGVALALVEPRFTLDWTHSVERTGWREVWALEPGGLRLVEAAVKGSGAGMEPGEGAVRQAGWWVWAPDLPVQKSVVLAASGATGSGWRLCSGSTCHEIGAAPGAAIRLEPCGGALGNG
jgi:hypothetical protein